MYVRIVTFGLSGLPHEEYVRHTGQIAAAFSGWPGLHAKIWLADPATNSYGGVYIFDTKDAADASRCTDLFARLLADSHFDGVSVTEFDVLDVPTAITAAMLR
ncbi:MULTISPECIES: YdhR family protein [Mycobacterium]|uniref:YdhR family protein n=1 Tax=Mycobacterium TaxID=1763 RepID=UPI00095F9C06|nr:MULTISPECIES: YdhR family protein [Mycobacterium]MCG7606786.1 YdhR family protein [Mycobacterium sp. CnD-18-1]OLT98175.1 hypothetical protein BKG60_01675 [Mycobacterium syngnathidarum]